MAYTKQRFSYKEENPRYEFTFPVEKMNIEGDVILIDKPYRCTSFDVVGQLRRQLRQYTQLKKIKVGHAGTLDPLATGLLIICIGNYTKKIDQYQSGDKEIWCRMGFHSVSFLSSSEKSLMVRTDMRTSIIH